MPPFRSQRVAAATGRIGRSARQSSLIRSLAFKTIEPHVPWAARGSFASSPPGARRSDERYEKHQQNENPYDRDSNLEAS
jgi:hypothetical protein